MDTWIVDKKNNIYQIKDFPSRLYELLIETIPNKKIRGFIYDKHPVDEFQKELLKLSEILNNYISVIRNMLCENVLEIQLSKYNIQGIAFQRYDEKILIRAVAGMEDNDLIHIDVLCGSGGASILLEALKQSFGQKGIRLYPLWNENVLKFYSKNGFKPYKQDLEEILDKIQRNPYKLTEKEDMYIMYSISPELYWFSEPQKDLYKGDWFEEIQMGTSKNNIV